MTMLREKMKFVPIDNVPFKIYFDRPYIKLKSNVVRHITLCFASSVSFNNVFYLITFMLIIQDMALQNPTLFTNGSSSIYGEL